MVINKSENIFILSALHSGSMGGKRTVDHICHIAKFQGDTRHVAIGHTEPPEITTLAKLSTKLPFFLPS